MVVDERTAEEFMKEVVNQVRAYDTYGTWEKRGDEDLLKEFLKGETNKPASFNFGGHCAVDPKAMLKIYAYFKALGVVIERRSNILTSTVINMDYEGNGNVIVYSGRLVLVNKTIRDANRFGFKSLEDMAKQGLKMIEKATQLLEKYEEVARL